MKQSTRMRMFLEYKEHPLREEYLKKKEKLMKKNRGASYYIGWIFIIFTWVMVPLYFPLLDFFQEADKEGLWLILGIINLLIALGGPVLHVLLSDEKTSHAPEIQKLIEEYDKKGLYEVDDPYEKECGEYNDYDIFVCSATQQPLSRDEQVWCQTRGNCKNCARFLRSMGFDPELFEERIQKW